MTTMSLQRFTSGIRELFKGTLKQAPRSRKKSHKPYRARLGVEQLEARELLATSLTATLSNGLLRVEGTDHNDTILVRQDNNAISVTGISIQTPTGNQSQVDARSVQRIEVYGLGGDDVIRLDTGSQPINVPALLDGGAGNDMLAGGGGVNTFTIGNDEADRVLNFKAGDQLAFTQPNQIKKAQVRGDGVVFSLRTDYGLYVDAKLSWANTRDFNLADDGTLYWLGTGGLLSKHTPAGWEDLANNVTKFSLALGNVFFLRGTDLYENLTVGWANTRDFAFDSQGTLYWLGTGGLLSKKPAGGGWQDLDSGIASFALDSAGSVVELGWNSYLFRFPPGGGADSQQFLDSGITSFVIEATGSIVQLGTDGSLWRFAPYGGYGSQRKIDNHVQSIGLAADGATLVVNYNSNIVKSAVKSDGTRYNLTNDGWLSEAGTPSWAGTKDFAIGSDNWLYWLGTRDTLNLLAKQVGSGWQNIDNHVQSFEFASDGVTPVITYTSDVVASTIAPDGTRYNLDKDHWLNQAGNHGWAHTAGFSIGADGRLCRLDTAGFLERYTGDGWKWMGDKIVKWQVTASGRCLALGSDGWLYENGAKNWGSTQDFTLDAQGTLYWLGTRQSLNQLAKQVGGGWQNIDNHAQSFEFASDGVTPVITFTSDVVASAIAPDGTHYNLDKDHWLNQAGNHGWAHTAGFSIGADGRLCRLDTAGFLERYTGDGWKWMGDKIVKWQVTASGRCLALGSDGWLYENGAKNWGNTQDFALDDQGTLYWLATSGLLQKQTPQGLRNVDNNVAAFQFGAPSGGRMIIQGKALIISYTPNVCKSAVAPDGTRYNLTKDGWLSENGSRNWGNTQDFKLDVYGTLYWLGNRQSLNQLAKQVGSGWQNIDNHVQSFDFASNEVTPVITYTSDVVDSAIAPDGTRYNLDRDHWLNQAGHHGWAHTAGFSIGADKRLYRLDTGGFLERYNGGWQWMGANIVKWQVTASGHCLALGSDGILSKDAIPTWAIVRGFNVHSNGDLEISFDNGFLYRVKADASVPQVEIIGGTTMIRGTMRTDLITVNESAGKAFVSINGTRTYIDRSNPMVILAGGDDDFMAIYATGCKITVFGGTGINSLYVAKPGRNVVNSDCQLVQLAAPDAPPQRDTNGCGPAAASEFLRIRGFPVDYDTAYRLIGPRPWGTTAGAMQSFLQRYLPSTVLEENASFDRIVEVLKQGKPVNALINWDGGLKSFHWVTICGMDLASNIVTFWDPGIGQLRNMTIASFAGMWNWSTGWLGDTILNLLGAKRGTIVF